MKTLVYICSPFRGNYDENTVHALAFSKFAFEMGYIPITPYIYFPRFLDDNDPAERAEALKAGLQLLLECSEMWVFGLDHPSEGMQMEIAEAIRHGILIRDGEMILKSSSWMKDLPEETQ